MPTLRYTRSHGPIYIQVHARRLLPSADPWISEDRLLRDGSRIRLLLLLVSFLFCLFISLSLSVSSEFRFIARTGSATYPVTGSSTSSFFSPCRRALHAGIDQTESRNKDCLERSVRGDSVY